MNTTFEMVFATQYCLTTEADYRLHLNILMEKGEQALKSHLKESNYPYSFKNVMISFRWSDLLDQSPASSSQDFIPSIVSKSFISVLPVKNNKSNNIKINKKSVDRLRRSLVYCIKHREDISKLFSVCNDLYHEKKKINWELSGKAIIIHPDGEIIDDSVDDVLKSLLQFEEDINNSSDFILSNNIEKYNEEVYELIRYVDEIKNELTRVIDLLNEIKEVPISDNCFSVEEKIDELQVVVESDTVTNVSKGGEFPFFTSFPINNKLNISIFPVWVKSWSDENGLARYKIDFCSGTFLTHIHFIPMKSNIIELIKSLTSGNGFTYFQGIPINEYHLSDDKIIFYLDGKEHVFKCVGNPTDSKLFLKVGFTTQKVGVTKAPIFANFPLLCHTLNYIKKSSTEPMENLIRFINSNGSTKLDFKIHYSPIFYDHMSKIAASTNVEDFIHSDMMEAPECISDPTSTKETIISFFRKSKSL